MDTGGLAQMSQNGFSVPSSGLASRRGGQNIKPLSFDTAKQAAEKDTAVPTPRTSRSHLLAGLRTAPKTSTATNFPASPTSAVSPTTQTFGRNVSYAGGSHHQDSYYSNGPKTAMPHYGGAQSYAAAQQSMMPQYASEQVLQTPEIRIEDQPQEAMDPNVYAQLMATNMFLAQQQQQLQQQLLSVQAAAARLSPAQQQAQLPMLAQQQAQLAHLQQQLAATSLINNQPNVYAYYDPATGQSTYFVDQSQMAGAAMYAELPQAYQQQLPQMQQHQNMNTPRVQVSPPPETQHAHGFRTTSPPKRYESPLEPTPLPPPSANAFRRGHKKVTSLANINSAVAASAQDAPRSAGPKTASFPLTPLTGGYGPGQGRAGEHPIRQPRGPPSFDELSAKPTARHEGSKNFATRTRRSAVHNLVRAGLVRRKGTGSSTGSGSMSPVSESAEEAGTPLTDNESDSGRSGSGSLSGDMECSVSSSRSSWGAIGSNRPGSNQQARKSVDSVSSVTSGCDSDSSSFANVFKNAGRAAKTDEATEGQRKTRLVLSQRRSNNMA